MPTVQQAAQIYEDPHTSTSPRKQHRRVPSVGDVLRGRRRDNSPTKQNQQVSTAEIYHSPSPLGERHINSPPQAQKVPTKQSDGTTGARPPMHQKTGSSVSLKDLILGRQEDQKMASPTKSPKKTKSSTNLAGLLRKRSKKDLKEPPRNQENISPTKSRPAEPTPIWQQFATQPQERNGVVQFPGSEGRSTQDEISMYTPRDYSEFRPAEQRNFHGYAPSSLDYKPPQRPFLQHQNSSRSSVFSEHLDDDVPALQRPKSRDQSSSRPSSSPLVPPSPKKESLSPKKEQKSSKVSEEKQKSPEKSKRSSRVLDAIATLNKRSRDTAPSTPVVEQAQPLSPQELDSAFEKVLDARNIPHNMRDTMRNLKPELKAALMRGERVGSGDSSNTPASGDERKSRSPTKKVDERPKSEDGEAKDGKRPRSRSRTRSRILTLTKRDAPGSPTKEDKEKSSSGSSLRSRSKSRPKSVDMSSSRPTSSRSLGSTGSTASLAAPDSATTPGDFIHYLREVQKPSLVEVGKLHKLRILLRNESVTWTDTFVLKGGMLEVVQLLYRISQVEWREEHEDNLLHETLLCLKALCTTDLAMERFSQIEDEFFPCILAMLFDPEKKGPSEYTTRGVIISLLFAHLSAARSQLSGHLEARARKILKYLQDPVPDQSKETLEFVSQMHTSRPYRVWQKEVSNVTKEVFWIFLHHLNVVPVLQNSNLELTYAEAHFPAPRPPHPAAPYVGGVEWDATQYLANHLDLMNGLIASVTSVEGRNELRDALKQSGFEKVMGGSLRTCKEKFYGGVHDGLKVWVRAAKVDQCRWKTCGPDAERWEL
ncbi:GTPase-binding protein rid1 [Cyphellophora attinorum]|uniref:GTPase-binding protein rid1 n=1 Tax=Cyphellophora attinorum TaxID=1664694 RepID=A0A0N0NQ93_9EURO|nr:GTPase-binding protein rid1 [Phialophora attinorum]KPI43641.1 GTPase-binding protein rid1 [Phialophora attinorum]